MPLILPRICLVCQIHHQDQQALCWHCQHRLPRLEEFCLGCGQSGPETCARCRQDGSIFHRFFAVFSYDEPIKTLIHRFKTEPSLDLLKFLAHQLLHFLPQEMRATECLIPVPMHAKRLSERGFHHTARLVKYLSQTLKRPYSLNYCEKIKATPKQAELNQFERHQNLIAAFQCHPTPHQHITIIDDVATTNQTLIQLGQGFQALGVNKIDVWVIAKA